MKESQRKFEDVWDQTGGKDVSRSQMHVGNYIKLEGSALMHGEPVHWQVGCPWQKHVMAHHVQVIQPEGRRIEKEKETTQHQVSLLSR